MMLYNKSLLLLPGNEEIKLISLLFSINNNSHSLELLLFSSITADKYSLKRKKKENYPNHLVESSHNLLVFNNLPYAILLI